MTAWMQTSTGWAIDLDAPNLARLDIAADVAASLAGSARFNAHREGNRDGAGPIYSVAQHCCVGADAVLDETGSVTTALAFLLHDAHEALIGDLTTPTAEALETALATVLRFVFGLDAPARVRAAIGRDPLAAAIDGLKNRLDHHLHPLAGLPHPLPEAMRKVVQEMDVRMLDLERRQILGETRSHPAARVWPPAVLAARPVRLRGRLRPWPTKRAAAEWLRRFEAWSIRPVAEATRIVPTRRRDSAAVAA
jgi:hypothetical protein